MRISSPGPVGVANSVWSHIPRNLTAFGSAIGPNQNVNQSLAASGTVTFTPAAGVARFFMGGAKAGAAGTAVYQYNDGTNIYTILSIVAGTNQTIGMQIFTSACFVQLKNNDAANPVIHALTLVDFAQ